MKIKDKALLADKIAIPFWIILIIYSIFEIFFKGNQLAWIVFFIASGALIVDSFLVIKSKYSIVSYLLIGSISGLIFGFLFGYFWIMFNLVEACSNLFCNIIIYPFILGFYIQGIVSNSCSEIGCAATVIIFGLGFGYAIIGALVGLIVYLIKTRKKYF